MPADALFFKTDFNDSSGVLPSFILRYVCLPKLPMCVAKYQEQTYILGNWKHAVVAFCILRSWKKEILWTPIILAVSSQTFQIHALKISVSTGYRKWDFYAPPPESGGVLCYTLRNFECPSVRPSVRLSVCPSVRPSVRRSVRPSVSTHHHSCIGNSSYSFRPILLKLYRCFKDGLKICILFFSESWNYFLSLFSHF